MTRTEGTPERESGPADGQGGGDAPLPQQAGPPEETQGIACPQPPDAAPWQAHLEKGEARARAGKPDDAIVEFREALKLKPDCAEAYDPLGAALAQKGNDAEAEANFRRAVELRPDVPEAHNRLGLCLGRQRKSEEAVAAYREALRLRPDFAEVRNNLGVLLHDLGKLDEAVEHLREGVRLSPRSANVHNSLGVALAAQGHAEEAIDCYHTALRLDPGFALAHNNLGNALRNEGRFDEALDAFQEALRLKPDYAEVYNNRAIVHVNRGQIAEAVAEYDQALRLNPDYPEAHANRAYGWLVGGDFARGWPEYEWRWKVKGVSPRSFPQPAWDGAPLGGRTVLLYTEQGLGDTLQFVRYAPLVKERGGRVLVECPRSLIPLLATCPGIDRLLVQGRPLPEFDCHAALLGLPRLFGTTLETVPARVPYLSADKALCGRWRERLEGNARLKVGIAWQGSPKYKGDRQRSLALLHFAQLAEVPGVRLFALQKGLGREQLAEASRHFWVTDLGAELDEGVGAFMDTAAVLKELDLVVTSDTAIAHLAGALGVPVWVALPWAADWRWLRDREDCPWYPTMRLFRQGSWGDWNGLFARIAGELHKRLDAAPAAPARSVAARQAERLHRRGLALVQAGRTGEAAELLRQALRLKPDLPGGHQNLGVVLAGLKQFEEAVASFGEALRLQPEAAEAHNNQGLAKLSLGRPEEAAACFERALALRPRAADVHVNLGVARMGQGRAAEAVRHYEDAARLKPDYAEAHSNLGNALRSLGRPGEAEAALRQALRLKPGLAEAHNNLGLVLGEQDRQEEAAACFREAVRLNPGHAEAHNNLGVTLADLGRLGEAVACLEECVAVRPDYAEARKNLALTWLRTGEFGRGWSEYEWRWRCPGAGPRPFRQPLWDGSPLEGRTILLHAEQGLGDTLQFVRYAALVRQRGGRVVLECQEGLAPLLSSCPGVAEIVPRGANLPDFSVHAPLLSLPRLFGTTLTTVPAEVPYLFPQEERCVRWRQRLPGGAGFRVGVAWQGNPKYRGDRHRSIQLLHFAHLALVPGVRLVSLQKGFGAEQLRALPSWFRVTDLGEELDREGGGAFVDTAAMLGEMDLVVTSDTAVAHLAGALGAPVWVALPFASDWRWLLDREDSPWYPSMRLFRQRAWGDWDGVFARIAGEVEKAAVAKTPGTETSVGIPAGEVTG